MAAAQECHLAIFNGSCALALELFASRHLVLFCRFRPNCVMLFSGHPCSLKSSSLSILVIFSITAFLCYFWGDIKAHSSRGQSAHSSPSSPSSHSSHLDVIPKILWYKLGPNGLTNDAKIWTDSCIKSNPDYQAKFITDVEADEYVQKAFASRPDIIEGFLGLAIPILKADLLRYMLLYNQGGIWSDLDITCEGVPIDDWIPPQFKANTGVVVGWEFDWGWPGPFVRQFASWTIMAKPGSPHMLQVIDDILDALHETLRRHNVSYGDVTLEMIGDVVDFSGPRRLTKGIFKSLERKLNRTVETAEVSEILEPKMLGDVLVMPGRSFGASSNHYTPEEIAQLPPPLVTHHYAGSWKNAHGGEAH